MNSFIKIILLFAAIACAVLGVAYGAKAIVAPPMQTKFDNMHLISLENDLKILDGKPSDMRADSVFRTTLQAARYFSEESLVTVIQSDSIIEQLANKYAPFFLHMAEGHFAQSSWSKEGNANLYARAKLLNGLRHQKNRQHSLSEALRTQVDSVMVKIDTYNKATNFVKDTVFISLDDSRDRIKTAQNYAKWKYFANCSDLKSAIDKFPILLGRNHFNFLKRRVNSLKWCNDRDTFNKVNLEIEEYNKNAEDIYGEFINVKGLKELADSLWNDFYTRSRQSNSYD